MRVLVTGVSGDIGFGIGRILKEKYSDLFLLGIDVVEDSAACCLYDLVQEAPRASDINYKDFILRLVNDFSIDIVIPTSEAEIASFWNEGLVGEIRELNKIVVILDRTIIETALDKYKTYTFLRDNDFLFPSTILASECAGSKLQGKKILKPRSGQGSKGIRTITSLEEIKDYELNDSYIVQEYLSDEENEYTCCVYRDEKNVRDIILKRKMKNGFTVSGEVVENASIKKYILEISEKLNLIGSMNLQLRMTTRGPVLFEINPRFSSTVVFREKMGFSDLYWALESQLGNKLGDYTPPKAGLKFYRGIQEYILN